MFFPYFIQSGIVCKTRKIGKSDYFKLNLENQFVKNLIKLDWSLTKRNVLPELEHLQKLTHNKFEVNYYEGWDGLKVMQDTLIESDVKNFDVVMYQSVAKVEYNKLPADKAINYNVELNKRKVGKRVAIIGNQSDFKSWRPFVTNSKTEYKILQNKDDKTAGEIAIFGEYIALISYADIPYGCLIKSPDIAKLLKLMFGQMWGSGKLKVLRSK